MRPEQLVALGGEILARKALAGELGLRELWVAFRGAAKYREAWRRGDIAPAAVALERVSRHCATCDALTIEESRLEGVRVGFCGDPASPSASSCGCLVALTIERGDGAAEIAAGAKVSVASEACPRWRPGSSEFWGPCGPEPS